MSDVDRLLADASAALDLREARPAGAPVGLAAVASPLRRRMLGTCAYCAATGNVPSEEFETTGELLECSRCGGTGDLDGLRLLEAYRCGWRDALEAAGGILREGLKVLGAAEELTKDQTVSIPIEKLRARVGG
jgi:hypothetical protein